MFVLFIPLPLSTSILPSVFAGLLNIQIFIEFFFFQDNINGVSYYLIFRMRACFSKVKIFISL